MRSTTISKCIGGHQNKNLGKVYLVTLDMGLLTFLTCITSTSLGLKEAGPYASPKRNPYPNM